MAMPGIDIFPQIMLDSQSGKGDILSTSLD
jgi:hypothetical protein